jgi:competence protein ComEA
VIPLAKTLLVAALLAAAPAALAAGKSLPPGERVDLNRASVAELMRLPGVGEKRAQAIVSHRSRQPFRRAEDVLQVKGLGRGWFAKVKANVVVGGVPGAASPPARK